jgi:tRNA modification GTPase
MHIPIQSSADDFTEINAPVISISAKTGDGLIKLAEVVEQTVGLKKLSPDAAILFNERQRSCVARALSSLNEAVMTLSGGFTYDAVGVCIDETLTGIMELTGERVTTEVANEVFSRFCVGK